MRRTLLFAAALLVGVVATLMALRLSSSNAQTTIPIGVSAYVNHISYEPAGLTYVYKYIVPGGQSIVSSYINTAYAYGRKPVLVVYTNYDSTTPNWSTWDATMNVIRQDGREVDVVVEPDLFGYIRGQGVCSTTGRQMVDRFLSTAPPNARLGFFMSPWMVPYTTVEQDAASWRQCWLAAGGDRMADIYVDVTDRDQEYKGTYPWPASQLQMFENWFKALKNATGRKIGVWQIPLGNSQCLNGRRSTFVENWLVQSKLLELSPYVDKMLFGPGIEDYDVANTQSWNLPQHVKYECGMFNSRVTALSNAPAPTGVPPTSTPVPPTIAPTRTNTPRPTSTPVAPTIAPTRTNTPRPTSTPVAPTIAPTRTNTPRPTSTPVAPTIAPTRTNTPAATSTPVPSVPTATSTPGTPANVNVEAESMWLPYGYGQTFADRWASGGRALLIWSNAGASKTVTLASATTRLTVWAKGDQCYGAPRMTVSVDGRRAFSAYVTSTRWTAYSAWAPVSAGTHRVKVTFDNDYYGRCDRNLRADRLAFSN